MKDVSLINERILAGKAAVFTERELEEAAPALSDVDVVTLSCPTAVSGSSAMLVVPVAERGVFTRAARIWLNGVRGFPGPAPNERLGLVDTLFFADEHGKDADYSGARLLRDLVERKEIGVECVSVEGDTYAGAFTMDDVQFARMYVYNAFLPAAAGGFLAAIGSGSRMLLNGAQGMVIGCGTRGSTDAPSLSLTAEMFEMDAALIGENGATNSLALAVPVLDQAVLDGLLAWPPDGGPGSTRLKDLILAGDFLLTDTDMHLPVLTTAS